ncbi:MAG: rhomboid family intramembrane serine protease, partial [Alphaproteobacteria bacterium]
MALCLSGFIWQESLDYRTAHNLVYQLGFIPAVFFTPADLPENMVLVPEWSTIFTSMFLHAGWMHIGGNMLYLWIFGDNVEAAMGRGRFILFYAICGTAAAMAQAALDPSSTIPMIGASGGIAGVLGAYLLLHPKAAIRCFFLILIFFRFINLPAWLVLGVWIGGQFVAVPQALSDTGGGVAYLAHIGGFLA